MMVVFGQTWIEDIALPALHVVERAYQLAAGGEFLRRSEIDRALEREGYTIADLQHLQGAGITKDLNQRCRASRPG